MHSEDGKCSGPCGTGLLDDSSYRSRTQEGRLEDVGGSMMKGYGGCCDSGSDKNGVAPIKTRLLRKGQSSGFDTMLGILNAIVKEYT